MSVLTKTYPCLPPRLPTVLSPAAPPAVPWLVFPSAERRNGWFRPDHSSHLLSPIHQSSGFFFNISGKCCVISWSELSCHLPLCHADEKVKKTLGDFFLITIKFCLRCKIIFNSLLYILLNTALNFRRIVSLQRKPWPWWTQTRLFCVELLPDLK